MFGWVDGGCNEGFLFRDDIEVNVAYIKRATMDERYRTSEGWNNQHDGSGGGYLRSNKINKIKN
jgi:hypothetical protein